MPGAGCQLVQEDSQLGDRARRERERVAEDVVGQLLAVRRHYVLVVKTARVLNAVMTSTQAAVHTTHHHVLVNAVMTSTQAAVHTTQHHILVVKTARVLNAVMTSTQAAVHTSQHHVLVVKTARVLWSMCAGHADEPST